MDRIDVTGIFVLVAIGYTLWRVVRWAIGRAKSKTSTGGTGGKNDGKPSKH